jgi:type II secretory pathway pseudopilin PulG
VKLNRIVPLKHRSAQKAFSLLESMIAIGIMGFLGLVIITAIDSGTKTTGLLDERVTATNLATSCIEVIRLEGFTVTEADITSNVTIPDNYNVDIDIECSTDGENFGTCAGGETLKMFTITVMHGEKAILSMCTFKTSFD